MEETGEESMKHICRFCNKRFPCGRSLGGHMRSHVINSTHHHHHHHHHHHQVKNKSGSSVLDKLCKQCGKGFQSWKALFGHMKCHSIKLPNKKNKNTENLNQDSWTSHSGNENSDSKNNRTERSRSRNRNKRYVVTTASSSISMNVNCNPISSNNASTSMVSEIEQEQEAEVAMSLMLLSRDLGRWAKDSIRNHSRMNRFAETDVCFDYLGRSEVGLSNTDEFNSDFGEFKDSKKRKFEGVACNRSFQKRKRDFELETETENEIGIKHKPMLDHDETINGCDSRTSNDHQESSSFDLDNGSLKIKTVVLRPHKCPICLKVFTSGQALGGHKRSHFFSKAKQNQENNTSMIKKPNELVRQSRGFLDLNMLPEEEMNLSSSTTEYKSYSWEDSSDHHSHESRIPCSLSTT